MYVWAKRCTLINDLRETGSGSVGRPESSNYLTRVKVPRHFNSKINNL